MSNLDIILSEAPAPVLDFLPEFLRLFDESASWLASKGRTGQWGIGAPSQRPGFLGSITSSLEKSEERGMTTIFARASEGSPIIGILTYNGGPHSGGSAPPAGEREIYIHLLLTTRDPSYRGLGTRLLGEAIAEARRREIKLLRLSCYAGGDRKIVSIYEGMGFRLSSGEVIFVKSWDDEKVLWPKVVLEMRLEELPEK